jgi:LasA protease
MMILRTHNPIQYRSPPFFTVLLILIFLLGACQPTPLPASVQDEMIVPEIPKLTQKVDKIQFIQPSGELSKLEHKTTPVASNTFSLSPTQAPAEIELTDQPEALLITPNPASIISTSKHLPTRYRAQSGDTLDSVAAHYGVQPDEIISPSTLPKDGMLAQGHLLLLPPRQTLISSHHITIDGRKLIPDSEVVNGPSAADFDVHEYLKRAGGYLGKHREYLGTTAWTSAADVITRIALENSINPRLLIALIEHECGCVLGDSTGMIREGYVLGVEQFEHRWLYLQLGWAVNQLSIGYYGWRTGSLTEFPLPNGIIIRPTPDSNAGSVAVLYYFASLAAQKALQKVPVGQQSILGPIPVDDSWIQAVDPQTGFPALYERMYGSAWERAGTVEPLFPAGLKQPKMELPFEPGYVWSYTSGPHKAWQTENALAALDLAPSTKWSGCVPTKAWAVAVADGPVVRSGNGYVIQDLDFSDPHGQMLPSDGKEQTGWAVLYMHIANEEKVQTGVYLEQGDPIGHPSCEGGPATGTHLHIARKFNGEWIAADGPLPFNLSGWIAHAGSKPYEGTFTKDGETVIAHPYGSYETLIWRPDEEMKPELTATAVANSAQDDQSD